jgi:RNA polymerase sigma factor (sigma-70 family)
MNTNVQHTLSESHYEAYMAKLLPYAYNILGDAMEAEDVVQEVLSSVYLQSADHVENPISYLVRAVINRSINAKKKGKIRREKYNGQWLPVPFQTEETIYRNIDKNKILQYALLVLLERLSAKERAVFILKETFDFQHDEIAEVLSTSVENSRQLYKRARKKLEVRADKLTVRDENANKTVTLLTDAILKGDITKLKALLAENIQSFSDGGPNTRSARKVIRGKDHVSKFLQAMYDKYYLEGSEVSLTEYNHSPALLFAKENFIYRCMVFEIQNQKIDNVFIIVNPEKLRRLNR